MLKKIFEMVAPPHLAMPNDSIGLQIGSWDHPVNKILVTLDVNEEVVDEAIALGVQMIFCHHAPLYKPLSRILTNEPGGKMIKKLLLYDISVYAAHTNLDIVTGGVNDALAKALQLQNIRILYPTKTDMLKKIVVFVPVSHHKQVVQAMCDAGAGAIGNYSHCTFNIKGTGTFLPGEDTNPYIGKEGVLEEVEEIRLETVVDAGNVQQVVQAMLKNHPYEEVAYDIYPLDRVATEFGLGRVGEYQEPVPYEEFINRVKDAVSADVLQIAGKANAAISTVAVCGGSGGKLLSHALANKADVYISGDITYHDAQWAKDHGLLLINAGHYQTEHLVVKQVTKQLQQLLLECGEQVEVIPSSVYTDPFAYI